MSPLEVECACGEAMLVAEIQPRHGMAVDRRRGFFLRVWFCCFALLRGRSGTAESSVPTSLQKVAREMSGQALDYALSRMIGVDYSTDRLRITCENIGGDDRRARELSTLAYLHDIVFNPAGAQALLALASPPSR